MSSTNLRSTLICSSAIKSWGWLKDGIICRGRGLRGGVYLQVSLWYESMWRTYLSCLDAWSYEYELGQPKRRKMFRKLYHHRFYENRTWKFEAPNLTQHCPFTNKNTWTVVSFAFFRSRRYIREISEKTTFPNNVPVNIVISDQGEIWWRQSLRLYKNIDITIIAQFAIRRPSRDITKTRFHK